MRRRRSRRPTRTHSRSTPMRSRGTGRAPALPSSFASGTSSSTRSAAAASSSRSRSSRRSGCFPDDGRVGFGVFSVGGDSPRVGFRVGHDVLDLAAHGLGQVFGAPTLNPFLALGRTSWEDTIRAHRRARPAAGRSRALSKTPSRGLPFAVGDYVDFYSSLEHATNLGRLFRPDAEPLLPNWRHLPVGYHGRAGTVVVCGTPIVRPCGQADRRRGRPLRADRAARHRARARLRRRRRQARSASRCRTAGVPRPRLRLRPGQRLERARHPGLGVPAARPVPREVVRDVDLGLGHAARRCSRTVRVPARSRIPNRCRTCRDRGRLGARHRARGRARRHRRLAHERARPLLDDAAAARARDGQRRRRSRTGDLFASGTISGPEHGSEGSLIELTRNGEHPIGLADGSTRAFLEDDDEVVLRGRAGELELAEVRGVVVPARC